MKNEGKRFEEDFIKSLHPETWRLRLQDAGGWSNGNNTRFTISNPCDFIVHDGITLYMLELKSHKGKSIPFSCMKQAEGLFLHCGHDNVIPGFILNFRDLEETYFLKADFVWLFMQESGRKSIDIKTCRESGTLITQNKVRVRYRYNFEDSIKKL